MNWVDLAVFGLLLISGLLGFVRGFVREVMGIAAWAGALAAGFYGLEYSRPIVSRWVTAPAWVDPIAFAATFIVSLVVLMLVAHMIGSLVRGSVLGGVDRTLGLVFGIARGAAVVVIAYILAGLVLPVDRWPPVVLEARLVGPVHDAAVWACTYVPEKHRPNIAALPSAKPPSADDMMRATAQGRATGKAPARE